MGRMKRYFFLALLVGWTAVLPACQSTQNFVRADGPVFIGAYAPEPPDFSGNLKVVTWNIKFAQEIDQAIGELQSQAELRGADFLLLQEMDETGVDAIARTLGYNYVYYPASVHAENGLNFGNAILSKWPLSQPGKILLPHESPANGQRRIAVTAVAAVGDQAIPIYSLHIETIALSSEKQLQQSEAIVQEIDPAAGVVIAGGDFNTIAQIGITALEERFARANMTRVAPGNRSTVIKAGKGFTADHIFVRGGKRLDSGVWPQTAASDHFPVWVDLSILQDEATENRHE